LYSALAILTALTLRAVFRLAYRQAEGLIGSIISLLGLTLRVPDHTTLSRRSATLAVPRLPPTAANGDARRVHDVAGRRQLAVRTQVGRLPLPHL
jgi:Transposase DDE domain